RHLPHVDRHRALRADRLPGNAVGECVGRRVTLVTHERAQRANHEHSAIGRPPRAGRPELLVRHPVDGAPVSGMGDVAWTPGSWRDKRAGQQPDWPDEGALDAALKRLATLPPLVFAGEARSLTAALAQVADGRAFLLQAAIAPRASTASRRTASATS